MRKISFQGKKEKACHDGIKEKENKIHRRFQYTFDCKERGRSKT